MKNAPTAPGRFVEFQGHSMLYFGGTSYLGLATLPAFQDLVVKNIRRWGTAWGSSRQANVQLAAYENGERFLAAFTGAPAALTISSGMLAGKLAIETLAKEPVSFFYFPGHHPAIQAPGQLPFYLDGRIHPQLLDDRPEQVVLLTDAVPTLRVQPVDLADISLLPPHKNITLVVDESHSLGILGTQGGGTYSGIQLPNVHRKILVASLGKALGLTGGLIGGDENFLAEVMQNPCYVGGAGMNPAFAQTLADGAALIRGQQEKLRESLAFLFNLIGHSDKVLFHPDYPILYPVHDGLYDWLYKNRILITHFPYPTSPKGLSRIILSAHHEKKDLERLAAVIEDFRP